MQPWYVIENEAEIPSPALLVYPARIRRNLTQMIQWGGGAARLRPHVKTHKLPQIVQMKLSVGIEKFKASTIAEAEMTAAAGGKDILLAYPTVGPNVGRLCRLAKMFPETRFSTIADEASAITHLAAAAHEQHLTIPVYLDLDVGMHRTGIALGAAAIHLYQQIVELPGIEPAGIHAYDGHLHHADEGELRRMHSETFSPVWDLISVLRGLGFPVPALIAGGTPTSGFFAADLAVEVGAGTSVLWDSGQNFLAPNERFEPAAILLARVVSRPAEDLLCIDLGHKAVASEMPHPRVQLQGLEEATATLHSEEHLVVRTSQASRFQVGSVLYGIPRHICPTVALHSDVWVVEDGIATGRWPVVARTRILSI